MALDIKAVNFDPPFNYLYLFYHFQMQETVYAFADQIMVYRAILNATKESEDFLRHHSQVADSVIGDNESTQSSGGCSYQS